MYTSIPWNVDVTSKLASGSVLKSHETQRPSSKVCVQCLPTKSISKSKILIITVKFFLDSVFARLGTSQRSRKSVFLGVRDWGLQFILPQKAAMLK